MICFHTGKAAIENTLINQRMRSKIARTSLATNGNPNSVSNDFWSMYVDSIDVFDCRLSGVVSLYAS